ncbi:MAG TPA: membrane protein insertion efficiency factor YidD [Friedmanniella sp.]
MKHLLIGLLKVYRLVVSPLYGNVCRYYPSCSAYALRAVEVHGAVRGSWMAGRRLLRCHPWTPGGYDPVPGTPEWREEQALLDAAHPDQQHDAHHRGHDHAPTTTKRSPVLQRVP